MKPNEPFLVAWNATGGAPKVSATSYGVFTNATEGSQLFARSIPGVYTFRIQIGKTEAEVRVTIEGNLPELTGKVQMQP